MIALDTNALMRWLLADILPPEDAPQVEAVGAAVESAGSAVLVPAVVAAELAWLLRTRLRMDRAQTGAVLRRLAEDPRISVEHDPAFGAALDAFARGGPGFVDHLLGQIARACGAATTLTFDRAAGRLSTFTALDPRA
jgi:predicted nucleic-acid-binding protein